MPAPQRFGFVTTMDADPATDGPAVPRGSYVTHAYEVELLAGPGLLRGHLEPDEVRILIDAPRRRRHLDARFGPHAHELRRAEAGGTQELVYFMVLDLRAGAAPGELFDEWCDLLRHSGWTLGAAVHLLSVEGDVFGLDTWSAQTGGDRASWRLPAPGGATATDAAAPQAEQLRHAWEALWTHDRGHRAGRCWNLLRGCSFAQVQGALPRIRAEWLAELWSAVPNAPDQTDDDRLLRLQVMTQVRAVAPVPELAALAAQLFRSEQRGVRVQALEALGLTRDPPPGVIPAAGPVADPAELLR